MADRIGDLAAQDEYVDPEAYKLLPSPEQYVERTAPAARVFIGASAEPPETDPFADVAARTRSRYGRLPVGDVDAATSDVIDTARSIPRGMLERFANAAARGGEAAQIEQGETPLSADQVAPAGISAIEGATGDWYQPRTPAGQYGRAMGEVLGNPANWVGTRLPFMLGMNALSGAAGQAGRDLYKGTPQENVAGFLGTWLPAIAERTLPLYNYIPTGAAGAFGGRMYQPPTYTPNPRAVIGGNNPPPDMVIQPSRISTRMPTAVNATENPLAPQRLQIDLAAMKQNPVLYEHNVNLVRDYPNLPLNQVGGTADEVAQNFIQHAKDNLIYLHNLVPPEIRQRSKLWYDGANRIANEMAKRYNVAPESAAWEAIRGLYQDTFKSNPANVAAIDAVWQQYRNGLLSLDGARQQILRLGGGIRPPDWWAGDRRPIGLDAGPRPPADAGNLSQSGLSDRAAGVGRRARGPVAGSTPAAFGALAALPAFSLPFYPAAHHQMGGLAASDQYR